MAKTPTPSKPETKDAAAKPAPAKKAPTKKPAAKKAAPKTAAPKTAAAKKPTEKKPAAKKPAAKPAAKPVAKKAAPKTPTPDAAATSETPGLNIHQDGGTGGSAGTDGTRQTRTAPQNSLQDEPQGEPMINVLAQYTKDLSFENPNAPESLRSGQSQPEVSIDMRIGREINADDQIEVSLLLKAHATRNGSTAFIAELEYAGLFAVQNVVMQQIQALMMIECPRILFPYARKILADMTQDGGFPPVMLDMPDFAGMYREEMMRRAQEQGLN